MSRISDNAEYQTSDTDINPSQVPTATLDIERYQNLLEAPELSDQQKEQLLKALWSMIVCLVEFGFQVKPNQNQN